MWRAEAQDGRVESRLHQEWLAAAGPHSLLLVWPSPCFHRFISISPGTWTCQALFRMAWQVFSVDTTLIKRKIENLHTFCFTIMRTVTPGNLSVSQPSAGWGWQRVRNLRVGKARISVPTIRGALSPCVCFLRTEFPRRRPWDTGVHGWGALAPLRLSFAASKAVWGWPLTTPPLWPCVIPALE